MQKKGYPTEATAILAALLDARKSAERELADCSGRSRSNPDNEDDEDGFIKDPLLVYARKGKRGETHH